MDATSDAVLMCSSYGGKMTPKRPLVVKRSMETMPPTSRYSGESPVRSPFLSQFRPLEAPLLRPHINVMISELFNLKHQNNSGQTFRPPSRSTGFMEPFGDWRDHSRKSLKIMMKNKLLICNVCDDGVCLEMFLPLPPL